MLNENIYKLCLQDDVGSLPDAVFIMVSYGTDASCMKKIQSHCAMCHNHHIQLYVKHLL